MTYTHRTRRPVAVFLIVLALVFLACQISVAQAQPKLSLRPVSQSSEKPAAQASSAAACSTALPSEDTVNSFLFQTFGYDPQITWKITDIRPSEVPGLAEVNVLVSGPQGSNPNRLLVSSDGKHAVAGDIIPFGAKPYEDARAKLEKGVNGPAKGPAKAPVTIVEFSDMQCPHCQKAAPIIESLLAQEPDARFVFQNFPLPGHNWAEKAAEFVDCIGRASGDAVWKFIQKTFEDQENITAANVDEKLKAIATASGANADEIAACASKPDTRARIEASIALGKSVGVTGTPTLYINGRQVGGGNPLEMQKKIVDFETSQDQPSKDQPSKEKTNKD
ncbi:MAG: thioredoxin domain-containing protein [Terriglobales bacterium]